MSRVLLLKLGKQRLTLATTPADSPRELFAFEASAREVMGGKDGFLGFYDWLRTPQGKVVGLRLSIDNRPDLNGLIPNAPYVVRDTPDIINFMFSSPEEIDEDASMDQDFYESRVCADELGATILSFCADSLTSEELGRIAGEAARHLES